MLGFVTWVRISIQFKCRVRIWFQCELGFRFNVSVWVRLRFMIMENCALM